MSFTPRAPDETDTELGRKLLFAHQAREDIADEANCYRLHDEFADEIPDLRIERYGDYAVMWVTSTLELERHRELAEALLHIGAKGVYLKVRVRTDLRRLQIDEVAKDQPVAGEGAAPEFEVYEHDRRFLVRLGDGLSTGLFVDQRDNRSLLQAQSRGARVLNLFCYTGSFSVAAGLGGAERVTSVDSSRAALKRVDENLKLNGLREAQHRLLKADAKRWLERATRRNERFDFIVLDPPSFSGSSNSSFSVERDYADLARQCFQLLDGGAQLLAVTNHRKTSREEFVRILSEAARRAQRELAFAEPQEPGADCRPKRNANLATKSVLCRVK